ncbi:glycosyltransferase family 2 protein [Caldimonas tepidiphila]|uniref:glycosyltransferase family 2 protein n=1 Tax=Caldimonas tepidiphila TaxID=2315841 RepID=UPI000E5B2669|nr:glycosyltransferase family 2 protein [Caldimonas tepidiphila]
MPLSPPHARTGAAGDCAPLVSVYLPTKDRLPRLRAAVDSVLAQSLADFELIVVNDGSRDGTAAYLDALAAQDARVRALHHEAPLGAPASRNEALRLARGTWVTGLDDDDQFHPGRLEAFVAFAGLMQRHGLAFSALYSQDEVVGAQGRRCTRKQSRAAFEDLLLRNCIGNQVFARREVFLEAGLYDEGMPAWQDLDLNLRIVGRFGPALLLDAPYYVFHDDERPDRISRKKKDRIMEAYRRIAAKWPQLPARARQNLYLQTLSAYYRFPITAGDISAYLRLGIAPGSLASLLRLLIHRLRT